MDDFSRGILDFFREMARPALGFSIVLLLLIGYVWYPGHETFATMTAAILTAVFAAWDCAIQSSIGKAFGRLLSGALFIWGSAIYYFVKIAGSTINEEPTWKILVEMRSAGSGMGFLAYGIGGAIGCALLIMKLGKQRNMASPPP